MGGALTAYFGSITIASAASASDTINLFTVAAGFTPLFGYVFGADLDTGTEALDFNIGTSDDDDYFGNFGVITGDAVSGIKPEASIWMPLGGAFRTTKPTEYAADTDIILTYVAAANAGGTGVLNTVLCGVMNDSRVV